MKNKIVKANIDRFSGFSDTYNSNRPVPPRIIPQIILTYLRENPRLVADVGSGTGLSTAIWRDIAQQVIGIEPNDDMRAAAERSVKADNIVFQKGVSNSTGLQSSSVDIVTISQAFHWMDINSTLDEVCRILKPGGVLAVYDCDWPPCADWEVDREFALLNEKCERISLAKENPGMKNDKSSYVRRLSEYGKFRYVREAVCHGVESCTPERMIGIALSQATILDAMKLDEAVNADVDRFCALVKASCGESFDIVFSYRLRLAIK